MRKTIVALFVCAMPFLGGFTSKITVSKSATPSTAKAVNSSEAVLYAKEKFESHVDQLYKDCHLPKALRPEVFRKAMIGYLNLNQTQPLANRRILSIIDFDLPSTAKRLFVIDLDNKKLLVNTLSAHGRNSGDNQAKHFSNLAESFQSSLGFYVTGSTYMGKHGYSLRLEGKDGSFNDNAYARSIVVHGADYVTEEFARLHGRLGRSQGCPALPPNMSKQVIDQIKGGSCLFIFATNTQYLTTSKHLNLNSVLTQFQSEPAKLPAQQASY
jgi:hypothetical protein